MSKKVFGISAIVAVVLTCIALVITLIATSVHKVQTHEIGIFYDTYGKVLGPVHTQGLYSWRPFSTVVVFSAVYTPVDIGVACVTHDGLVVKLHASFQYVAKPESILSIARTFKDEDTYFENIKSSATSAIHQTCSEFSISDYQNSRPIIQTRMSTNLETFLGKLNASSLAAQLTNVVVPTDWNQAVFNQQQAFQDINLAHNQRNQLLFFAQNKLLLAEQDSEVSLQNAAANASVAMLTSQQQGIAIKSQYSSFSFICKSLMDSLNITGSELVNLLTNRVIGSSGGSLDVALQAVLP